MILLSTLFLLLGALTSWGVIRFLRIAGFGTKQASIVQSHHIHTGVIPRIGGIGLIAGLALIFGLSFLSLGAERMFNPLNLGVFFGAMGAFGLGIIDDFRPLGARLKLLVQVLIAIFAHECGLEIKMVTLPFTEISIQLGLLSYGLTILWFVGMMNLMNLIDGLDGLAGGIGLMLMGLLAYLALNQAGSFPFLIAIGMAGAIFGFLVHNFPPAKVYMGDSGAYLIGFLIAALALVNSQKGTVVAAMIAPLMALAVPILDVTFAILRRGIKGLPLFRPDSRHIHHRMLKSGVSRRRALLTLYSITLFALMGGVLIFVERGRYLGLFMGFSFVVILWALRGQKISAASLNLLLSESLQFRQDIRNALYLKDWFITEAERADSGAHLWSDYHFILKKMGFCRAEMEINHSTRSYYIPHTEHDVLEALHLIEHKLPGGKVLLYGEQEFLSQRQFELLTEIAMEAWVKASEKWLETHGSALDFEAKASEAKSYKAQKNRSLYRPTY